MPSIKIQNFGPIRAGYKENNGFIPIDRFMAFIGSQGSGKSSVVKLISTFSWLEKALFQEKTTINELSKIDYFKIYFGHQQIKNYFQPDSFIEYQGDIYHFKYEKDILKIKREDSFTYQIPKITFIPSERNFLSVIEQVEKVKQIPSTLSWCLEEFNKACREMDGPIEMPINNILFRYDAQKRTPFIEGPNSEFNLKLTEAASGIQSFAPLFIVLNYLNGFISNQQKVSYSEEELEKFRKEIENLAIPNIPRTLRDEALKVLFEKFTVNHLVNIIEEIEQNLFPDSQRAILNKVLEFTNNLPNNKLILTTHSPYIIGYMTLAMKGYMLLEKIKSNSILTDRLNKVIPSASCFNPKDVAIYELEGGDIIKVDAKNGVISGKNYLNEHMVEVNSLFAQLQEIEEEASWA